MTASETNSPGFRMVEAVVSAEECDALVESLSNAKVSRGRAGARHLMAVPEIARLASNERLIKIARRELRAEPSPFRVTLFEKSGKANWLVARAFGYYQAFLKDRSLPRITYDARFHEKSFELHREVEFNCVSELHLEPHRTQGSETNV